jgi:hypothetical protein
LGPALTIFIGDLAIFRRGSGSGSKNFQQKLDFQFRFRYNITIEQVSLL